MDLNKLSCDIKVIDSSITELVQEAKTLFSTFDALSSSISKLEKNLNGTKAYFPFKYQLRIESDSYTKRLEPSHDIQEIGGYDLSGYRICKYWYLVWESEENSKGFRLFLIAEEKKIIYHVGPEDCFEDEFQSKCVFKKPFMETALSIRIQYSEYLISFIDSFTSYLKKYRTAIEANKSF